MASLWYETIPCSGAADDETREITVTPQPAERGVLITIRREGGRPIRVKLAPGWARVFADMVKQSAAQVQYKPPSASAQGASRFPRAS